MNKGVIYAALAYFFWGIFPLYWKSIDHVPAYETLFHRMFWTFIVTLIILAIRRDYRWIVKLRQRKVLFSFLASGMLIGANWLVFIWAVNNGFIVEASLGYFINPLVHVLFGVILLRERLRKPQLLAILIAACGVLYLTFNYGRFPVIALFLAGSFAIYAFIRKTAALNSLEGLSLETGFLFIPSLIYIMNSEIYRHGALLHSDKLTMVLLVMSGIVTALPLLLFASGARRIPLVTIGILQYIAPTGQFLIGVFVYHEPFPRVRLIGFSLIWIALIIYSFESFFYYYNRLQSKSV